MDDLYLSIGNFLLKHFEFTRVLVFCLMSVIIFAALIPNSFKTYIIWKQTKKVRALSLSIMLGIFVLVILVTIYPLLVSEILTFNTKIDRNLYRMGIFCVLFSFALFFSIPRTIHWYKNLNKTMSVKNFSMMCFYSFISFITVSTLFIPTIYLAISSMR